MEKKLFEIGMINASLNREIAERMQAEGLPQVFIDTFAANYRKLERGETGLIPESEIQPVEDLPLAQQQLVEIARALDQQARVLFNGSPETAAAMGADGVHLSSRALFEHQTRPVAPELLVAASCHSPADLARAAELGVDFAVLSPVLPTPSHPDAQPLGWSRFAAWVDEAAVPTYALGGMRPGLMDTAWAHGGQGIAGIRGLWGDDQAG